MAKIDTNLIKSKVTMTDTLEALGFGLDIPAHHGNVYRMKCPIHNGNNPTSFKVDDNQGIASCFSVCNKTWDIIQIAMDVLKIPFTEVLKWFDKTFGLGLYLDTNATPEEKASYKKNLELFEAKREISLKRKRLEQRIYNKVLSCIDLDQQKIDELNSQSKVVKTDTEIAFIVDTKFKYEAHKGVLEHLIDALMGNLNYLNEPFGPMPSLGSTDKEIYDSLLKFTKEQWKDLLWYL